MLAKLRTFKGYNIHGFLVLDQKEQNDGGHYVQVIAWGEYSLRLIDLFYANDESHEQTKASLITASAEYLAPDWMLAGCTDESGNAYLVTAHNALLGLRAVSEKTPTYRNAIHLRQLVAGVKTLLYSADITSLSDSHVLIAAGTVFGEVIVWSCFLDNPSSPLGSIHHFFTGHEGSIFGVNISPEIPSLHGNQSGRLLASCSDDRTVRIWDISDCERKTRNDPSTYSTDGFELRSTGFGKEDGRNYELGSECCLAKAFGHISRIWGVRFLPMVGGDRHRLSLLSFGEDATCLLWKLAWETPSEGSDFQLGQVSSFHNHSGKNIFSLDMHRVGPETIIHTGGADGAIKTLRIHEGGDVVNGDSTLKKKGRGPLRAFAFVSSDSFIATSALGEIQLGRIDFDTQNPTPSISKETLCMEEDLRSFSAVTGLPHKGLAVLGNAQGLIRLYNHSTKSLSKIAQVGQRILGIFAADPEPRTYPKSNRSHLSFVTSYANSGRADVFLVSMGQSGEMHIDNIAIELPRNFEVNCASLIWRDEYLVLGSREGGLALFQISNTNPPLQPVTVIRRVHAGTSATGVKMIVPFWSSRGSDTSVEYVMSCGRDGNYCVHELEITGCSEEPINFRTVHRSPSSMNHDLTGAYFNQESHDLMLYGFQHQYFILFNESAQTVLASIDCGGARGHWDFHPGDEPTGGVFLWAQYGILNARRIPSNSSRPLRAGAHGREVKTMEVFNAADKAKTIFATGAEDTTVRIFGPSSPRAESTWGAFKSLRVIKHATSLQQVGFSKDGNFLFASSGLEDFYVWRIRWIPVFGVAAHLMALGPKDDSSSDLRVTSFDILDVEEGGSGQGFLLCLTLSNSTIKVNYLFLILLVILIYRSSTSHHPAIRATSPC